MIGFHFEDERGAENIPSFATNETTERTNYDYLAAVHGDFKSRFFYTLGGSLEHYSLFGVETSPRAGFSLYALKPRNGIFSGTRIVFNYGDAVREPALTDQFGSLYQFLVTNGDQPVAQQLHIAPAGCPDGADLRGRPRTGLPERTHHLPRHATSTMSSAGRLNTWAATCFPISFPT